MICNSINNRLTVPVKLTTYSHCRLIAATRAAAMASACAIIVAGSAASAGELTGYVRSDGVNSVLHRDSLNHVQEIFGPPWSHDDLTALTGAPVASGKPAAYVRSDGSTRSCFGA